MTRHYDEPALDAYLKHYFRISKLYAGPNRCDMRKAGERRVDEAGLKATVKLREIFRNEPKPGLLELLAFSGKRWESGYGRFEDRVAALGSPMQEGAMMRVQAGGPTRRVA